MEPFTDPESLRNRDEIEFQTKTEILEKSEFNASREDLNDLDNHAAIGLTNDQGEVLLQNDGSHGWTLIACPVEEDQEWVAAVSSYTRELLGNPIQIDDIERVRRRDYRVEGDEDLQISIYNVVFRGSAIDRVAFEDGESTSDEIQQTRWFSDAPEDQPDTIQEDVRLFLRE